jgi:hypothetical protein
VADPITDAEMDALPPEIVQAAVDGISLRAAAISGGTPRTGASTCGYLAAFALPAAAGIWRVVGQRLAELEQLRDDIVTLVDDPDGPCPGCLRLLVKQHRDDTEDAQAIEREDAKVAVRSVFGPIAAGLVHLDDRRR